MSKTVLGRKLGDLLHEAKGFESTASLGTLESANPRALRPGLKRLLDGVETGEIERKVHAPIPPWYLFGADLLLLMLASVLVWPHGMVAPGIRNIAFSLFLVLAGALFSILAVVSSGHRTSRPMRGGWRIIRQGTGKAEHVIMIYAEAHVFVGEVQQAPDGSITVCPLPVEGLGPLSPAENQRLGSAAVEAYAKLVRRTGRNASGVVGVVPVKESGVDTPMAGDYGIADLTRD